MYVIAQPPSAAAITVTGAASTTAANLSTFNVISGEPGAGSQLSLSLPGSNRLNGQPFRVRAAGYSSIAAGTFTTSITYMIHASTTAGFTATAANSLLLTTTATAITISAATAKVIPWAAELLISGDTVSGLMSGSGSGQVNNGALTTWPATAANGTWNQLTNALTSINFATEPPMQFAVSVQVGTTSNTFPLSNVTHTLTQLQLEA
jgi:hypothetical protein